MVLKQGSQEFFKDRGLVLFNRLLNLHPAELVN